MASQVVGSRRSEVGGRTGLAGLAITIVTLYQNTLSPDHGLLKAFFPRGVCRFQPTCSEYAKEAITRHGLVHGSILAVRRVSRCHPWSRGGHDPVPHGGKFQVPISKFQTNSKFQ